MSAFNLEHSPAYYFGEILAHALLVVLIAASLIIWGPPAERLSFVWLTAVGLAIWTLLEYALHRFVLHKLRPFSDWHARHHEQPAALIGFPFAISVVLFAVLCFLPALAVTDPWRAGALTLGLLAGYLAYGCLHHLMHQHTNSGWLRRRQVQHARHHSKRNGDNGPYGVTTGFWDWLFRT